MRLPALFAAALVLAGCTGAPEPSPASPEIRPALDENFPDPDVLEVDGTYFLYATEGDNHNVQVATSTDLTSWEAMEQDALPELPAWIIPGKTWAPEVTQLAPGRFVMYFTATNFSPTMQCIGVATATDPAGPFVVQGEGMLVCPPDEGGAIDASTFDDDGVLRLVWKNDGNCCGLDTWLQSAPLSEDGLNLVGEVTRLLKQTEDWEGALVEAPTVIKRDGGYSLWYSANDYGGPAYAIGYASAPALDGPWTKLEGPWLSTEASGHAILGPGGQDLVIAPDGSDAMVLHGWDPSFTYRRVYVVSVQWADGSPLPVLPG